MGTGLARKLSKEPRGPCNNLAEDQMKLTGTVNTGEVISEWRTGVMTEIVTAR